VKQASSNKLRTSVKGESFTDSRRVDNYRDILRIQTYSITNNHERQMQTHLVQIFKGVQRYVGVRRQYKNKKE